MALFIEVHIAPEAAKDPATARKLTEVCPVGIFTAAPDGSASVVEKNVDECTLCELCLHVGPPGQVEVRKLYDDGALLERT